MQQGGGAVADPVPGEDLAQPGRVRQTEEAGRLLGLPRQRLDQRDELLAEPAVEAGAAAERVDAGRVDAGQRGQLVDQVVRLVRAAGPCS